MCTPNLFDYATKELSQDAMICWMIAWAQTESTDKGTCEQALQHIGRSFVAALIAKHNVAVTGEIRCPACPETVEIYQQDKAIDVLARIQDGGETHVLLIEDKTGTSGDPETLNRYYETVRDGRTRLGDVSHQMIRPIYLKTGNQSCAKDTRIEGHTPFKIFNRKDFLEILSTYRGTHPLMTDFRKHLQRLEDDFERFKSWRLQDDRASWPEGAWERFFRRLECELEDADWGYVHNQKGGFLGLWWQWVSIPDPAEELFLQLEIVPTDPQNQRLCFKVDVGEADRAIRSTVRDLYRKAILKAACGDHVVKPRRMGSGKTMTAAEWNGDWLVFADDGALDVRSTVENLKESERILLDAGKNAV